MISMVDFGTVIIAVLGSSAFSVVVSRSLDFFKPTRHEERLSSLVAELEAQVKLKQIPIENGEVKEGADKDLSEVVSLLNVSSRHVLKQRLPRILLPSGLSASLAITLVSMVLAFTLIGAGVVLSQIWGWSEATTTLVSTVVMLLFALFAIYLVLGASNARDGIRALITVKLNQHDIQPDGKICSFKDDEMSYILLPRKRSFLMRNMIGSSDLSAVELYLNQSH